MNKEEFLKAIKEAFDEENNKLDNIIDKCDDILGTLACINSSHIPNLETRKAIENAEKGIDVEEVDSVEELFRELTEEPTVFPQEDQGYDQFEEPFEYPDIKEITTKEEYDIAIGLHRKLIMMDDRTEEQQKYFVEMIDHISDYEDKNCEFLK